MLVSLFYTTHLFLTHPLSLSLSLIHFTFLSFSIKISCSHLPSLRSCVKIRHGQSQDVIEHVVVKLPCSLQRRQIQEQRRKYDCHGLKIKTRLPIWIMSKFFLGTYFHQFNLALGSITLWLVFIWTCLVYPNKRICCYLNAALNNPNQWYFPQWWVFSGCLQL